MTIQTPFIILWIENDFGEMKDGIQHVSNLLEEHLKRPVETAQALWLEDAYVKAEEMKTHPPDIIILDIMLPRTEEDFHTDPQVVDHNAGYLLWRRLRLRYRRDPIGQVPMLVLTAREKPEFREKMEAETIGLMWLGKPVAPSEIVKEIVQLLSKPRGTTVTEVVK